jgi:hypothetical protein
MFYSHLSSETFMGEKTTSYIESKIAADRIAKHFPDSFIIFMLRDPIQRAISNYHFSCHHGLEKLSFRDALDAEPGRIKQFKNPTVSVCPFAYQARGHYIRYIESWAQNFPRSQLILLTSEHLLGNESAVKTCFSRLGLRSDVQLQDVANPVNASNKLSISAYDQTAIQYLKKQYEVSNRQLTEKFNVSTTPWQM